MSEQTHTTAGYIAEAMEAREAWVSAGTEVLACDTETTGLAYKDRPFCATIAFYSGESHEALESYYFDLGTAEAANTLSLCLDEARVWVFHNAKFDLQMLLAAGIISKEMVFNPWGVIEDTHALAFLLNEQRDSYGLKNLAIELLNLDDTIEVPYKSGPRAKTGETRPVSAEKYAIDEARRKLKLKKEDGYDKLPREVVYPYAKKDAEYTLRLYEVLMREMDQQDDALRALYQTEMKLSLALLKMEQAGVGVDLEYATSKYKELNAEVYRLEQFVLEATEEEKFSQHHEWIKGILSKRGHTVQNTQRETLELVDDEVAQAIVERGRVKKTADYFAAITREQVDGVLHTSFKQHKPVTGRMSSGEQEVT